MTGFLPPNPIIGVSLRIRLGGARTEKALPVNGKVNAEYAANLRIHRIRTGGRKNAFPAPCAGLPLSRDKLYGRIFPRIPLFALSFQRFMLPDFKAELTAALAAACRALAPDAQLFSSPPQQPCLNAPKTAIFGRIRFALPPCNSPRRSSKIRAKSPPTCYNPGLPPLHFFQHLPHKFVGAMSCINLDNAQRGIVSWRRSGANARHHNSASVGSHQRKS